MLENAKRQFFLVLLTIVAGLACMLTLRIPLGPDLKGGTQLLYEVPAEVLKDLVEKEGASVDAIMEQTVTVIHERIDPTGTLDPLITRSGDTGILIELGYFQDPQELKRVLERISNLGKLEMRIVADGDFQKANVSFRMDQERKRLEDWLKNPENAAKIAEDARNIRLFNEDASQGPLAAGNLAWYAHQIKPSTDPNREGMWDTSYTVIPNLQGSTVKAYSETDWNNGMVPEAMLKKDPKEQFLVEFLALNMKERFFTGEQLDPSGVGIGSGRNGGLAVNYAIEAALRSDYLTWSEEYIGKCSAIVLNGLVKSAPVFNGPIPGVGVIEGSFTRDEVDELVKVLRTGSLRVEPELMSKQTIGAQLGEEAIFRGLISILAGGVLVFLFVLLYYGVAGSIACITLLLNVYLLYAAMLFMQATITLPGLGGIVLTLGMAVDANVLIYERIREELQKGKEVLQAVRAGFERAMSAILDSNITTFLVGIVLFQVGVGPVKGFAVTLMVGIITTIFTQFFVTRLLFHYALDKHKLDNWKPRTLFDAKNVDFVGKIKLCVGASAIAIVAGLAYAFLQVPREEMLGIDFTGGANLRIVLLDSTDAQSIRDALRADKQFVEAYPNATVNQYGEQGNEFNVRLKLTDAQRDEIAVGRKAHRELRKAAEDAKEAPPAPYEPPYVEELQRVFAGKLVKPAFSDPLTTPVATGQNLEWAQIDVHFAKKIAVASLVEKIGNGLANLKVTPLPDETATDARDLRLEWKTQDSTREWELPAIVQKQLEGWTEAKIVDGQPAMEDGKPVEVPIVLSDPFPEAQEIQGRLVDTLRNAAIGALILAWGLIVLYLRVRFHEYKYGVAAVVALVHDVLVTFAAVVFANHIGLVHAEISLSMIAAFLTIIGYSVNDTIVVFDRIRENRIDNLRNGTNEPLRNLINRSLNQTLSRTVLTTVLTLFVVLAQFFVNWGSESDLESFAFAMIVGMVSGVYSTIFIAAPILIWMDRGEAPIITERPVDVTAIETDEVDSVQAEA